MSQNIVIVSFYGRARKYTMFIYVHYVDKYFSNNSHSRGSNANILSSLFYGLILHINCFTYVHIARRFLSILRRYIFVSIIEITVRINLCVI